MYAVLAEESLSRLSSNTGSTMDANDSTCLHAHNCISNLTKSKKTFWPSGNFLVRYFYDTFCTSGCIVCHENTWRWSVRCYKGL